MELIAAAIARSDDDLRVYYRQVVQSYEEISLSPPRYIPLRNISYGATNTIAKISGSRFDEGMTSALTNPSDRVERTEAMLRT